MPELLRKTRLARLEKVKALHGAGIESDLKALMIYPEVTLQSVGDKYGITREGVRQIVERVYGKGSYTKARVAKAKRMVMIRRRVKLERAFPLHMRTVETMRREGLDVKLPDGWPRKSLAVVNNAKVQITVTKGNTNKSHFKITPSKLAPDYIVLYVRRWRLWLVLPYRGEQTVYVRNDLGDVSMYVNAWHSLAARGAR